MTFASEAAFQRGVLHACKQLQIPVQKFNDSFSHGIPDLFVGNFGWVELKMVGGHVKGTQIAWAKKFSDQPLPVVLLFSDGRVYDLARCSPGLATKNWFIRNSAAELNPSRSPIRFR